MDCALAELAAVVSPVYGGAAYGHWPAAALAGYAFGLSLSAASMRQVCRFRRRMRDFERRDALTGLANCVEFDRVLSETLEHAREALGCVAIISIDLDGFKQVNDIRGRRAGDTVLAGIAADLHAAIAGHSGPSSLLARIGGDQFAVLIPRPNGKDEVTAAMDAVLKAVRESAAAHSPGIPITASVGASLYPDHSADGPTLIRMADIAMYQSKSRNGDCAALFDSVANGVDFGSSAVVATLRDALEHDRLRVLYQPIVDVRGSAVLFEALVRIEAPGSGLLSPDLFIPVAEQTGFIREIGSAVLKQACRQVRQWRDSGLPVMVAVNVSPVELRTPSFAERAAAIAAEAGAPANSICMEITETAMIRDPETTERNLAALRAAGFSIAMDDFGTGYSSLSMLHRLPLDHLKIDRSFSQAIAADQRMRMVVARTIQLAHELGMSVIAEGIEHAEQFDTARAMECDYFQGFFFSTPLPARQATALLAGITRRSDLLRLENALRESKLQSVDTGAGDAGDLEKVEMPL